LTPWALALSFLVGAVCAVRLPVLLFTVIVVIVVVAFASFISAGSTVERVVWAFTHAGALEAGYLFVHCLFYLVYVRRAARVGKRPAAEMTSKYSPD